MGVGNLLGHLSWLDPLLDFQNRAWGLSNGNCVSEIVNAWSLPRYVLNLLCRALTQTTSIAAPTYPLCAHVSSAVVIAAIRDGSAVHSVCCRGDCFRIFLWRHCGPGKESRDCRIWSCVWCPPSVRSVSTMNHHLHCTYVWQSRWCVRKGFFISLFKKITVRNRAHKCIWTGRRRRNAAGIWLRSYN